MDGLNKALDDIREEMQGVPAQQQQEPEAQVPSSLADLVEVPQLPVQQPMAPDLPQVP